MWREGFYKNYWWQAKVYDEGSRFGINSGRISKLQIRLWSDGKKDEVVYNYDRGPDVDNCPKDVLAYVLAKFK